MYRATTTAEGGGGFPPDSLYVFITASEPTKGVIAYTNAAGQMFEQDFSIADPMHGYTFAIGDADGAELQGYNDSGAILPFSSDEERPVSVSFHVTSEKDVSVYGLSQGFQTGDAFLVFPTDALGKEYRVMAYESDDVDIPQSYDKWWFTPSQFAVVATENNTTVAIVPTAPTNRYGNATRTVTLQRGQTYLVQEDMKSVEHGDLTGTSIIASKPIAVFSGHQRTSIPRSTSGRDILIEQMPPVGTWGQSAFVVPLAKAKGAVRPVNDIFRVLAAHDNTVVFINGIQTATLQAGQFYQGRADAVQHITATTPVLVGQYQQSSSSDKFGDPSLIIIPPSEQFLPEHRFVSAQPRYRWDTVYKEQYIAVIAPTNTVSTVQLDGISINQAAFQPIGTAGYSYAVIELQDGFHSVVADTGIGVYAYGYGAWVSYGYTTGAGLHPIDFQAPRVTTGTVCAGVHGFVFDSASSDSHLDRVYVSTASLVNVQVVLKEKSTLGDSLEFIANLIDPYTDGSFTLIAKDSAGFETHKDIAIGGFAVQSALATSAIPIPHEEFEAGKGKNVCVDYVLANKSAFPQTITTATFQHATPGFTIGSTLPFVIPPHSSAVIQLCFSPETAGSFTDTLLVGNGCVERAVLAFGISTPSAIVELKVLDTRGEPGTIVPIPIKIVQSSHLSESGVQNLRVALHYTSNTLSYQGDAVEKKIIGEDEHIIVLISTTHSGDSIIGRLRFFVGLSTDTLTTVYIDSGSAVDGRASVVGREGIFTTDGICRENGVRLFNHDGRIAVATRLINTDGRIAMLPVRPTPSGGQTEIDIKTIESGVTRLSVLNLLGQTVKDVYDGQLEPGSHTLIMDVGDLATGIYFLLLQTPTETMVQRMEVQR